MKGKRFLSLVLCICLTVCSMMASTAAAEETAKYEVPQRVSGLLSAIEVIKPGENIEDITLVSRGQFAAYAARLMGDAFMGEGKQYYKDVPEGSFCFKEVSLLVELGALSVGEDKTFNPNNVITYNEACKILLHILGYGDYAQVNGGWPNGYVLMAKRTGLNSGVSGYEMNIQNALQMIYNACHTEVMDVKSVFGEYTHIAQGEATILSVSRNIYMAEGRVEKNYAVSLIDSQPLKANMVQINGQLLDKGKTKVDEVLGHYVDVYYQKAKTDAYGTVVYFNDETTSIKIDAEDFEYKPGELKYYEEKSGGYKEKKLTIGTNVPIMLNGKRVRTEVQKAFDETTNGHIQVVSYEHEVILVHIRRKETLVIRSTNENQQSVWDEYRKNKYFIFDEEEHERLNVYKGQYVGEKISFYHMQKGQVLTIYKSLDGKIADVYMSDSSIVGTITQIKDEEVAIDGVFYKVNKEMAPYLDLSLGVNATFYFDVDGEISGAEPIIDDNVFAYIYGVREKDEAFDTGIQIKVFTVAGNHETLDVKVPVNVDKQRITATSALLTKLLSTGDMSTYRQFVGIKKNSQGKVISIDTAAASKAEAEDIGTLVTQLKYEGTPTNYRIPSNNPSFEFGPIPYRGTRVIVVPEENGPSVDEELFKIADKNYFNKVWGYKISSYKTDFLNPYADYIVVREEYIPTRLYGTELPIMVDEIYTSLDKNGDPVKVIKGVQQGLLYEAECIDNPTFKMINNSGNLAAYTGSIQSVDDLKRGDLIRTSVGLNGKVGLIQILHDFEENEKPYWFGKGYTGKPGELRSETNFYTGFNLTAGYVIDFYYDKGRELDWVERPPVVVDLGYDDATTVDRPGFLLATDAITIYDIKQDKVFIGTSWEDITAYSSGYGGSYLIAASVSYNSRGLYMYIYPGGE